jgi:hypothetical protein
MTHSNAFIEPVFSWKTYNTVGAVTCGPARNLRCVMLGCLTTLLVALNDVINEQEWKGVLFGVH